MAHNPLTSKYEAVLAELTTISCRILVFSAFAAKSPRRISLAPGSSVMAKFLSEPSRFKLTDELIASSSKLTRSYDKLNSTNATGESALQNSTLQTVQQPWQVQIDHNHVLRCLIVKSTTFHSQVGLELERIIEISMSVMCMLLPRVLDLQ